MRSTYSPGVILSTVPYLVQYILYALNQVLYSAELEIAACHLPFSEQSMNMADQN